MVYIQYIVLMIFITGYFNTIYYMDSEKNPYYIIEDIFQEKIIFLVYILI
jgi:hypothetical protein